MYISYRPLDKQINGCTTDKACAPPRNIHVLHTERCRVDINVMALGFLIQFQSTGKTNLQTVEESGVYINA